MSAGVVKKHYWNTMCCNCNDQGTEIKILNVMKIYFIASSLLKCNEIILKLLFSSYNHTSMNFIFVKSQQSNWQWILIMYSAC